MKGSLEKILTSYGPVGDALEFAKLGEELQIAGDLRHAASAYDRAYGLDPKNTRIAQVRAKLLGYLSITEHGILFRYIPAGTFLMGSDDGDPDEQPVHPVRLSEYWIAETPISWAAYCQLMGWQPPPEAVPDGYWEAFRKRMESRDFRGDDQDPFRYLDGDNRIRLQYCENETLRARDWHAHAQPQIWESGGKPVTSESIFGMPERAHPDSPWGYDQKPMVAVSWMQAQVLAQHLTNDVIQYGLPTEAQWEKAARGGLISAKYAWGNELPTPDSCDCNRMMDLSIQPMRRFAPNGYCLYAMCGGVWEWVQDWYDANYYAESPILDPTGPAGEDCEEKVLRGGSWSDMPEAVTVSYRIARLSADARRSRHSCPNIGFRVVRVERS